MATDHIRYDVLARDALRGVLRRVLADAAEHAGFRAVLTLASHASGTSRVHSRSRAMPSNR